MCVFALVWTGAGYSTSDLDRIISDMYNLKMGGSAAAKILPETEVHISFPSNMCAMQCLFACVQF